MESSEEERAYLEWLLEERQVRAGGERKRSVVMTVVGDLSLRTTPHTAPKEMEWREPPIEFKECVVLLLLLLPSPQPASSPADLTGTPTLSTRAMSSDACGWPRFVHTKARAKKKRDPLRIARGEGRRGRCSCRCRASVQQAHAVSRLDSLRAADESRIQTERRLPMSKAAPTTPRKGSTPSRSSARRKSQDSSTIDLLLDRQPSDASTQPATPKKGGPRTPRTSLAPSGVPGVMRESSPLSKLREENWNITESPHQGRTSHAFLLSRSNSDNDNDDELFAKVASVFFPVAPRHWQRCAACAGASDESRERNRPCASGGEDPAFAAQGKHSPWRGCNLTKGCRSWQTPRSASTL